MGISVRINMSRVCHPWVSILRAGPGRGARRPGALSAARDGREEAGGEEAGGEEAGRTRPRAGSVCITYTLSTSNGICAL